MNALAAAILQPLENRLSDAPGGLRAVMSPGRAESPARYNCSKPRGILALDPDERTMKSRIH